MSWSVGNNRVESAVVLMAMVAEASRVVERLKMTRIDSPFDPRLPMRVHVRRMGERENTVVLVTNGIDKRFKVDRVATQPAVLSAWESIRIFRPDVVVSAGIAGGFRQFGAGIGDVYVSTESIKYHDRRIPIEGFHAYGIGSFRCCEVPVLAERLGLKRGIVSTGNSFVSSSSDLEGIRRNGAAIVDMEAAAVAEVAELVNVPMFAVKSVSDLIDAPEETTVQFARNVDLAVARLASRLAEILEFVIGRTIGEL